MFHIAVVDLILELYPKRQSELATWHWVILNDLVLRIGEVDGFSASGEQGVACGEGVGEG